MTHIQGPLGITDFDKEGMLVEGFEQMGSMVTIYNPSYYPWHMETLGFTKEVDWVQIRMDIPKEVPPKYARVSKLSKEMFGLQVKKLTNHEIQKEGYGKKVFDLLNIAYSPLFGYTEFTDKQIDSFVNQYLPLVDKRMISAVEDKQGQLVGIAISMGSLAHAMKKTHGNLMPFGWSP